MYIINQAIERLVCKGSKLNTDSVNIKGDSDKKEPLH